MEVQFLLSSSCKMLSPTVLVCSVLVVNTGKGGDSAHKHCVCTCVHEDLMVLLPSLYGIYSRSNMCVFFIVKVHSF